MSSLWVGLIAVIVGTFLSVCGMLVVRKKVGVETLITYHEVAGYLLSVVGTLYAVLLGFIIVEAMQHIQDLRVLVEDEASGVANIFLLANGLPSERRLKIRKQCHDYAYAVVHDEWQEMERGGYSTQAFGHIRSLIKEITEFKPQDPQQEGIHAQMLSEICDTSAKRRNRIVNAAHGMSPVMWVVLISGGMFTVLFTYFFGVTHLRAQVLMTTLVSLTLALNLFVLSILNSPFSGDLGVKPDSFVLNVALFEHFDDVKIPSKGELYGRDR